VSLSPLRGLSLRGVIPLGPDRDEWREEVLEWTTELVAFPTYRRSEEGTDEAFRRALSGAIDWVEQWAAERDVECFNWEDRVLELSIGSGQPVTGIVAHLDVVPPGDEAWDHGDPFEVSAYEHEGDTVLEGRGVTDDKGPVAALLKVLDDLRKQPSSYSGTIRLILDTAEEIGFENMRTYLNEHPDRVPDRTMVMDGYFPMVAGEKGIGWYDVNVEMDLPNRPESDLELVSIEGGGAYNQVPGSATAEIMIGSPSDPIDRAIFECPDAIQSRLSLHREGTRAYVRGEGESGHGSTPQQGRNALEPVLYLVGQLADDLNCPGPLRSVIAEGFEGGGEYRWDGSWLGIDATDDRFPTGTTANLGTFSYDGNTLNLGLDVRFMPDQSSSRLREVIASRFENWAGPGDRTDVEVVQSEPPLLVDTGETLPSRALSSYRTVTGQSDAEPVYMGGRTDATVIPNSFAFGLMRHDRAPFYNFHGTNERVYLKELVEAALIYHHTLSKGED
jgi:succinyl-diaminopimelate desuccinylase